MNGKRRAAAMAGAMALWVGAAAAMPPSADGLFEIALWANDDSVEHLPNLVATSSHPCGAIAVLRLDRMPPVVEPEGAVAAEHVMEIDSEGRTLRQWSAPVDYQPLALRGEALLLRHGDQLLWVGTDGRLARADPAQTLTAVESEDCPAAAPHGNSEYRQCGLVHDVESAARRLIVYESACT